MGPLLEGLAASVKTIDLVFTGVLGGIRPIHVVDDDVHHLIECQRGHLPPCPLFFLLHEMLSEVERVEAHDRDHFLALICVQFVQLRNGGTVDDPLDEGLRLPPYLPVFPPYVPHFLNPSAPVIGQAEEMGNTRHLSETAWAGLSLCNHRILSM